MFTHTKCEGTKDREQWGKYFYNGIYRAYASVMRDVFLTNTYGEIFDIGLALRSIRDEKGNLGYNSQDLDPYVWGLMNGFSPYYFERYPGAIRALKKKSIEKASIFNFTIRQTSISFYWRLLELHAAKYLLQNQEFFEGFKLYKPALKQDKLAKLGKSFEYGFIDRSVSTLAMCFELWETLKRLSPEEFSALHNDKQWGPYFNILVFNLVKGELILKEYAKEVTELIEADKTRGLLKNNLPFMKFLAAFASYDSPWPDFYKVAFPNYDFSTGNITSKEIEGFDKRILNLELIPEMCNK